MVQLNLPPCDLKLKMISGKPAVFDILRKKFVILTPEEWVRQHFVHHLINFYRYPKSLIKVESSLKYNEMPNRSDIVVYDRDGNCFLLVECKAASVDIDNKVFRQIARYNTTLKAPYLAVTNGIKHFCCSIDHSKGSYLFINDLPPFAGTVS